MQNKSLVPLALIVGEHVIKGFTKVIGTLLDLQLLSVDFIFNVIDSLIKFGDVHLSIFKPSFSSFVLLLDRKDFVLKRLLSFNSFLSGFFKRFHVFSNSLKLFFNSLELGLCKFCSIDCSLKLILLNSKLS